MADEKYSAGARYERKAMREYLRRQIATEQKFVTAVPAVSALNKALAYVMSRQSRYDKKPGGLGKKSRG